MMDKNYIIAERTFAPVTLPAPIVIMAIIAGVITLLIVARSYKSNDESLQVIAIPFLLVIAFTITPWLHYEMGVSKGEAKYNPIPMSQVQQYIHVDKSKVVIDELPEEYFYYDKIDKPEHVGRRILNSKTIHYMKKLLWSMRTATRLD